MGDTWDGVPQQAGPLNQRITGRHAEQSLVGIREGVIIDRAFTDENGNRGKKAPQYTIRDILTGQIIQGGVERVHMAGGADDGDDIPLHVATKTFSGAPLTRYTPSNDIDGDHVVYCCIEGTRQRAVILGVLPHAEATYGAAAADGERRFMTHKGTSSNIDQNGNVDVELAQGKTLKVAGKNFSVQVDDSDSGKTITLTANGHTFKLGSTGPHFVEVDGSTYSFLNTEDLMRDLANCIGNLLIATTVAGPVTWTNSAQISAFILQLTQGSYNSQTLKHG